MPPRRGSSVLLLSLQVALVGAWEASHACSGEGAQPGPVAVAYEGSGCDFANLVRRATVVVGFPMAFQKRSTFIAQYPYLSLASWARRNRGPVATIYFPTNRWFMSADDAHVLRQLANAINKFNRAGYPMFAVLEGYADERGEAGDNRTLSKRRVMRVSQTLESMVESKSKFKVRERRFFGESKATSGRSAWAEDRRVNIFVTGDPVSLDDQEDHRRGAEKRAQVFKAFMFESHEWLKRGLWYLVEQYALDYQRPVNIRSWDLDKVEALLRALLTSSELNFFDRELEGTSGFRREKVLVQWHEVLIARLFQEAARRHAASGWRLDN